MKIESPPGFPVLRGLNFTVRAVEEGTGIPFDRRPSLFYTHIWNRTAVRLTGHTQFAQDFAEFHLKKDVTGKLYSEYNSIFFKPGGFEWFRIFALAHENSHALVHQIAPGIDTVIKERSDPSVDINDPRVIKKTIYFSINEGLATWMAYDSLWQSMSRIKDRLELNRRHITTGEETLEEFMSNPQELIDHPRTLLYLGGHYFIGAAMVILLDHMKTAEALKLVANNPPSEESVLDDPEGYAFSLLSK